MLRKSYDWVMGLAASPNAERALGTVSFIESSFFPIPPDTMLIPMVLADRSKAWRYAFVCTLTSVLGGLAGYAIGYFLYEAVAQPLLEFYGNLEKFEAFKASYNEQGALIVLIGGATPVPYKVITIASGATQMNLAVFTIVSVIARGARFYAVCGLLYFFGEPIRNFIERYLGWVALASIVLFFGGFYLLKFAH